MSEVQNQQQVDKLYAGKFRTVEELEDGYKNSAKVYQERETLRKEFEELEKIPDDYNTPTGVTLHEADLAEAKRIAKESGMTQAQYEKFVKQTEAKSRAQYEQFRGGQKGDWIGQSQHAPGLCQESLSRKTA